MNNDVEVLNDSNNNEQVQTINQNQVNSVSVETPIINNDINNVPVEKLPSKNNGKKVLKISIISIVALLIIGIVGFIIYKETVLLNKNSIIKNSIVEMFNYFDSSVDRYSNSIIPFDANEESLGIDGTLKVSSNYNDEELDLTKLSNYSIKYNGALDLKNNKLSASVNLNKDNKSLLSTNMYINGRYGLIESKQLSYYAYSFNTGRDIKEINLNNKDNKDTIKRVIDRTKDIILTKINENDITKDSVEETINGNKSKYTRFTYTVDINNIVNEVLKYYIQDTSVTNNIAEIASTDVETVKKTIQKMIDSNNKQQMIKYEIYVDSLFGTFKQVKIHGDNTDDRYFRLYAVENGYDYEIVSGDDKINGNYSNNKLTIESNDLKIEYEKQEDKLKLVVKYSTDGYYFVIDFDMISKKENDKQNIKSYFAINVGESNNSMDFKIENELNIFKNATVKPITAFITKDISTIDNNEAGDIEAKLENIISEITKDIYKNSDDLVLVPYANDL